MADTLTALDATVCDQEPIRFPGSIQPHGVMLVADARSLAVTHVAGDVEQRLGVAAWEGEALAALIGAAFAAKVAALQDRPSSTGYLGQLRAPTGETLDVSAHLSGGHAIVELEVAAAHGHPCSMMMDDLAEAASGFALASSLAELTGRAAVDFRRLTGFDRVMIYQFLDDGVGTVLSESLRPGQRSFLNQHFPAADIPSQARALYLHQPVRVIPDARYRPVPLRPPWVASAPLDMSACSLRSVSPIHLQYLFNMGVGASASFSIVKDGALWGLVACHNEGPALIAYDARAACRSLAGSLARQIKAKEEAEGYRQRIRLRSFEDDIVVLLSREGSLDRTLSKHLKEIGRMMGSDGVAILRGRELVAHGVCPAESDLRELVTWLLGRPLEPIFSTDRLGALYPAADAYQHLGSGLLAVTLSADEPWIILWFRVQQIETVNWAGNPHKGGGTDLDQLTPRASFDAWAETVSGQARAWSLPEAEAATRLRLALLGVQQVRRERELNRQLTKILLDKDQLLQQKEFLIGEVNHRVQNSLQLVSSFLSLQARESEDPALRAALGEARRRLTAVALVHRRLYRADQIETVDAARYIEELCVDTLSFMGHEWSQHLTLDLLPVLVSTDRAVTLGLILTELMINSNKHAYGGAPGPIQVELVQDRTHLRLVVADRGVGRTSSRKGFGSRVMEGLLGQLGGELSYRDTLPGLRAEVAVPIQAGEGSLPT